MVVSGGIVAVITASVVAGIAFGAIRNDVDIIKSDRRLNPGRYVSRDQHDADIKRLDQKLDLIYSRLCEVGRSLEEHDRKR